MYPTQTLVNWVFIKIAETNKSSTTKPWLFVSIFNRYVYVRMFVFPWHIGKVFQGETTLEITRIHLMVRKYILRKFLEIYHSKLFFVYFTLTKNSFLSSRSDVIHLINLSCTVSTYNQFFLQLIDCITATAFKNSKLKCKIVVKLLNQIKQSLDIFKASLTTAIKILTVAFPILHPSSCSAGACRPLAKLLDRTRAHTKHSKGVLR